MFIRYYQDLIRAVANDNYEVIDQLCEQTLTIELAAKIYEFEKYKGVQFRLINDTSRLEDKKKTKVKGVHDGKLVQPIYEVQVLNHFYVSNMSIDREKNPSLRDFKMVQKAQNWIDYVRKGSDKEASDYMDSSVLDTLEELKQHYQVESQDDKEVVSSKMYHMSEATIQSQSQEAQGDVPVDIDIREIEERRKFDNSKMVQKEAMKAFKEIKSHEYRLLQLYKPHKIHQNMDQFIDEMRKKERESTVELDPKRLQSKEYLQQVREEFHKNNPTDLKSLPFMTLGMYIEQEKQKSDMYTFIRIFCPTLYDKYVRIKRDGDDKFAKQGNQALQSLRQANIGTEIGIRKQNRLVKWIKRLFFTSKVEKQQGSQLIEVFDVLIKTQERLQMFHLPSGVDYLVNPSLSTYYRKMDDLFKRGQPTDDKDSVYVMSVDKTLYDVQDPQFIQYHCLRFEIDRSKNTNQRQPGVKITDIDYWLEGNRHAKANSEEFIKIQESEQEAKKL